MPCGFFDQSCNFLRPRDIDRVTGAEDFDLVAVGSCGIAPFQVGLMVLSLSANIQLGLLLHAGVVMTALKLSAKLDTCDRAMKAACSADKSAAKYS